ncbi:hypothetical protein GCM10007242_07910 [Pigmentiphaga litoralis]|uniref:hypothetical protein n=1 Tax=Pigmentiphaga litoralis TaxID=516702 RepID=UPI00167672DE|nr:hypothetical protein [Pigmentiphaga litoralis]GGX05028.1 hypothetical protein GCM10007242_07910 [Pigmentiphaga litoralis]
MPFDLGLLTLASVLRRGRHLDHLSSSITLIALAWGLLQWPMGFGTQIGSALATLLVLVGVLQKIWAMRVALDADLFDALGRAEGEHASARNDPASHAPASHDPASHDPASHDPASQQPASHNPPGPAPDITARLAAMDAMLVGTGLMPARLAGRPLPPRTQGALRLLVIQAALVGFQVALTLSSLLAMPWLFPGY